MANISSAYGKITLIAKDKTIDTLVELIKICLGGEGYYTDLFGETKRTVELPAVVRGLVKNGYKEKTFDFEGEGRWAYSWNIDMFVAHIKEFCEDDKDNMIWKLGSDEQKEAWAERKSKARELWGQIEGELWWALFDYQDDEAGGEYLYQGVALVSSEMTEKDMSIIIKGDCYDYTPENLVKLGFYDDIEDARDTQREWGKV